MAEAKKKPAEKQSHKVDWFAARQMYLEDSTLSYSDLASKLGVTKRAVQEIGTREQWPMLRQSLAEKAFEKFQSKLLDVKSAAQDRHLMHFQNLQALINKSMLSMNESNYLKDKKGQVVYNGKGEPIKIPPNPFELEKLAKALKVSIDGERTVLGLPTSVTGVSDPNGGSVWTGFADMVKKADKVIKESGAENGRNSGVSGSSDSNGDKK